MQRVLNSSMTKREMWISGSGNHDGICPAALREDDLLNWYCFQQLAFLRMDEKFFSKIVQKQRNKGGKPCIVNSIPVPLGGGTRAGQGGTSSGRSIVESEDREGSN